MLLEVCANSFQSAYNAHRAGAQRIELCENLEVGGLTPTTSTIKKVLKETTIEVFVLIRPRAGDFVYSEEEFQYMKQQLLRAKSLGCHGVVSGVLTKEDAIDIKRTQELIELTKPLAFTFHRAFDQLKDPYLGVTQLIELGVDRILTSGQARSAIQGLDVLNEIKALASRRLLILPGAGIHPGNAQAFKENGFAEIHASARSFGNTGDVSEHSNHEIIRALLEIIS